MNFSYQNHILITIITTIGTLLIANHALQYSPLSNHLSVILFSWLYRAEIIRLPVLDQINRLEKHDFGKRLAIVMPFTRKDINQLLLRNIANWPPQSCLATRKYGKFIDFLLYYNKDLTELTGPEFDALKRSFQPFINNGCFSALKFMQANLNETQDSYPNGPSNMFFQLFHQPKFLHTYHAMFLMEPDVFPCRMNWVDRVYEESVLDSEYWLKGSILRDTRHAVDYSTYTFANHINGNGWYRLSDGQFQRFISGTVEPAFRKQPEQFVHSWDIAVELVLNNRHLIGWDEYVSIRHRFKHTAVIQNYYRAHHNLTVICQSASETFLVHGRNLYR